METPLRYGNCFEDFQPGQVFRHATPRTVTDGDSAVYTALTGTRVLCHSSEMAARQLGYAGRPLDDLLVFNIAFGKTVPDISLNAVANLGYADVRFLAPVYAGDTLSAESTVIGVKENASSPSGVVYVLSVCRNQHGACVLSWVRWVMVRKRDADAPAPVALVPKLPLAVAPGQLVAAPSIRTADALETWCRASGSRRLWGDFIAGQRIDHPCGMTIEEADHMSATRLYQNNARVHFDAIHMRDSATARRLVYGGHVISVCRALSHDGLENVLSVLAINGGRHVAPTVAGDTLYACSEVMERLTLPQRQDVGALRLRLLGLKNVAPADVDVLRGADGKQYHPAVVLDLDYTVAVPAGSLAGR
ncbi:MaoC family dehydratase [Achromobacter veterisilvae]|uniref:MaoC family dehydratase n=1 Tax=Achromobacter veterisilvae TaxID=2069367 RepID=A0ABZ2S0P0_9BURK